MIGSSMSQTHNSTPWRPTFSPRYRASNQQSSSSPPTPSWPSPSLQHTPHRRQGPNLGPHHDSEVIGQRQHVVHLQHVEHPVVTPLEDLVVADCKHEPDGGLITVDDDDGWHGEGHEGRRDRPQALKVVNPLLLALVLNTFTSWIQWLWYPFLLLLLLLTTRHEVEKQVGIWYRIVAALFIGLSIGVRRKVPLFECNWRARIDNGWQLHVKEEGDRDLGKKLSSWKRFLKWIKNNLK